MPKDGVGDCTGFEENDINGCENGEVPKFGGAEGVDKGVIPFAPFEDVCGATSIHTGDDTDGVTPVLACGGLALPPNKSISKESVTRIWSVPDPFLRWVGVTLGGVMTFCRIGGFAGGFGGEGDRMGEEMKSSKSSNEVDMILEELGGWGKSGDCGEKPEAN